MIILIAITYIVEYYFIISICVGRTMIIYCVICRSCMLDNGGQCVMTTGM